MPAKIVVTPDRKNMEIAFDRSVQKVVDYSSELLRTTLRKAVIDYGLQLHSYISEGSGSPVAYLFNQIAESDDYLELRMSIGSEIVQPFLESELASLNVAPKDKNENDIFTEKLIGFADQMVTDFLSSVSDLEGREHALQQFAESADRNLKGAYETLKEYQTS